MWEIVSRKSIGLINLGANIQDIIELLGNTYSTFKRVPNDTNTVFAFDNISIHLTCGQDDSVKIITIFCPNKTYYSNIQLLGRRIEVVKNELNNNGIRTIDEDAGLWVEEAGFLLVDIDGKVDGVELYSD